MRLGGAQLLILQQQAISAWAISGTCGRSRDAAAAGQQAELDLREAELDLWRVDRDPVVGGQADLEAAAEGTR